jgi:hypothetical protein
VLNIECSTHHFVIAIVYYKKTNNMTRLGGFFGKLLKRCSSLSKQKKEALPHIRSLSQSNTSPYPQAMIIS